MSENRMLLDEIRDLKRRLQALETRQEHPGFAASDVARLSVANTFAGVQTIPNTGLHLLDTNASHDLIVKPGSDLSADRTLTVITGDADRTMTLSGNLDVNSATTITAAASTVLDDATVAAMVNTLGGASSVGSGGLARSTSPIFATQISTPAIVTASGPLTVTPADGNMDIAAYLEVKGTQLMRFKYAPSGFDVANAPISLLYTGSSAAGRPHGTYLISFGARDNSNKILGELWFLEVGQNSPSGAGYKYATGRISGSAYVRCFEVANTGNDLRIEWLVSDSVTAASFDDGIEITVMELGAGISEGHFGTFETVNITTRSGGTELNSGGNTQATFGSTNDHWLMGNFGIGITTPAGRVHINGTADDQQLIVEAHSTQTAALVEFRDSAGAVMSGVRGNGGFIPASLADANAANNTIYYSTTAAKLVYKDGAGVVNNLY